MNLNYRYAIAIYKYGEELNISASLKDSIEKINYTFEESIDLYHFFHDIFVSDNEKLKAIENLFKESLTKEIRIILQFLLFKKRLSILPYIATAYLDFLKKESKIIDVNVCANIDNLTDEVKKTITDSLKKEYPNEVLNFILTKDQSIIGGYKVKIKDKIYNYTINHYLKELEKDLLNLEEE